MQGYVRACLHLHTENERQALEFVADLLAHIVHYRLADEGMKIGRLNFSHAVKYEEMTEKLKVRPWSYWMSRAMCCVCHGVMPTGVNPRQAGSIPTDKQPLSPKPHPSLHRRSAASRARTAAWASGSTCAARCSTPRGPRSARGGAFLALDLPLHLYMFVPWILGGALRGGSCWSVRRDGVI